MADLCELIGVQTIWTSPYHLQTNGQCERFNSTLINMLGTLPKEKKSRVEKPHWNIGICIQLYPKLSHRVQPLLPHVWQTTSPSSRCGTWFGSMYHHGAKHFKIYSKWEHTKWAHEKAEAFQAKEAQRHK